MENGEKKPDYVVLRHDRRRDLRKQLLVLKVMGEDTKGAFFGYAKTISRGGMFIASVNPRKIGEEFYITFRLPFIERDIKCKCVVVWRREYEPHKQDPGMGIKFLDLDEEVRDRIEDWVSNRI